MDQTLHDDTLIGLLPDSCRELINEGVSLRVVLALVEHFGGCHVRIPLAPNPSGYIAQAIGCDAAAELVEACRGVDFHVPRCVRLKEHRRNLSIIRDYAVGRPLRAIATRHQLSERQINTIVAKAGLPKRIKAADKK